jgi:hypothetical protein
MKRIYFLGRTSISTLSFPFPAHCRRFHDPDTGLYLYGDLYVVDEVIRELQDKQG